MSRKPLDTLVPGLPEGFLLSGIVAAVRGERCVFVRTDKGTVYVLNKGGIDVARAWDSTPRDRTAFATLTGVPFARIEAEMRRRASENGKLEKANRQRRLESEAAALGYRLVKKR